MKKSFTPIVILLLLSICLSSCFNKQQKELNFLGKNAYEVSVYEELLELEKVKLSDVVLAFEAYSSSHKLDEETLEHFEKLKRKLARATDADGYITSEKGQLRYLLAFRDSIGKEKPKEAKIKIFPATYTYGIPNKNNAGAWKNIGPFGNPEVHWSATGNGALQYVEMHPTNPAIMYVCSRNGGLWKTTNYGKNWKPLTDYFLTDNTSTIEVCSANPKVLYLGAAEDQKVWYSANEGMSWEDRSSGIEGDIYKIESDPQDSSRALLATSKGLFITTNSGNSWSKLIDGLFTEIEITNNWDFIVVSKQRDEGGPKMPPTLFFSQDKGNTFKEVTVKDGLQVHAFYTAIHESSTGNDIVYVYGILDGNTPTRFIGLWKSEFIPNPQNGEGHFNFIEVKHTNYNYPNGPVILRESNNAQGFEEDRDSYTSVNPFSRAVWVSEFYVSPNNPDWLITQNTKMWGSDDGGVLWHFKPSYGGSNWADNRYFTTNVAKDSVFWCNDGGIWAMKETDLFPTDAMVQASGLSKDAYMSSKVVAKNGDICVIEGSQMSVSMQNKGVFMTGGQDVGQLFTRNGRDSHVASADVYRGSIKPTKDSQFITGGIKIKFTGNTDKYLFYDNITPDHFNTNRLYGFTYKNITQGQDITLLARSPQGKDAWEIKSFRGENRANNNGHGWDSAFDNWELFDLSTIGITKLHPGTFEQSRANKEIAFLGDEVGKRLFITENLSSSNPIWVALENAPKSGRYRIATHQYNENFITLATNKGVYISRDKGETWLKRGDFPETNPQNVLVDKNTSEGIYIHTPLTIYYIDETLDDWIEFNKGLPLQSLSDMDIAYYPNNDSRLYVSKYGRGVWSTPLYSNLKENMPVADFDVFGNSEKEITVGDKVEFRDQSLNAESLRWTFENGTERIIINNKHTPEITFNKKGYYKVTLEATNTKGSNTKVKEDYILVLDKATNPTCNLTADADLSWFRKLNRININSDANPLIINSSKNHEKIQKTFQLLVGKSQEIEIYDSYSGYNFYIKAWIDFNGDGDFDDTGEEIVNSNGKIEANGAPFTSNFTVPNTASLNKLLTLRIVALDSDSAPISCQTSGYRQTIDFNVKINSVVDFNSSHTVLSENSTSLQTDFVGVSSVNQYGFVYATLNADLNIDNSESVVVTSTLSDNNFTLLAENLEYNRAYYYRPFVRNTEGIFYGEVQNFQLASFKMPQLDSRSALNLGNNTWKLRGFVFPEGNQLDALSIEYGETVFDNSLSINPRNFPTDNNYEINGDIQVIAGKVYQYRIKAKLEGKVYYSRIRTLNTNQTLCTPTVTNKAWYRLINSVTFDGNTTNSTGSSGYEDFSSVIFNVKAGQSYNLSITDSYVGANGSSYYVYIDFDNDNIFDVNYEMVQTQSNVDTDIYTTTITIPNTAIVYDTHLRMRIAVDYNSKAVINGPNPCNVNSGEFEDYTIQINSGLLAINDYNLNDIATVYPNPVTQYLHIEFNELTDGESVYEIYTIEGKKVLKNKINNNKRINLSRLSSGIYLLKINKENKVYTSKFIKK